MADSLYNELPNTKQTSTPIKEDSKLAITIGSIPNGDGFALYNGVKFLELFDYDKVKYPYAYLCVYDVSASKEEYKGESMAELRLSSMPFTAYPSEGKAKFIGTFDQALYFGINGDRLAADNANIGFADGEWVLSFERNNMTTSATGAYITLSEITWCNRDLLNEDGSVYLPTTDTISLDGCTVIEWAGNTDGSVSADGFCKVSGAIIDAEALSGSLYVTKELTTGALSVSENISFAESAPGMLRDPNGNVCVISDTSAGETGIYFAESNGGHYVSLLAYPAPADGVSDTTATVSFNCTALENTEPIDSIKAWVYKKADGLDTTIPATWTSDSFAAPEYGTIHTFTELEPDTEYEVYGCIFVNGEATDHNALAEFTTLESDDLKPVYKMVGGAWVKQTAYERQDGKWVLISRAEIPDADEYDVVFENGTIYIKAAPATLRENTLEVR